jgi:hypothetical protein
MLSRRFVQPKHEISFTWVGKKELCLNNLSRKSWDKKKDHLTLGFVGFQNTYWMLFIEIVSYSQETFSVIEVWPEIP